MRAIGGIEVGWIVDQSESRARECARKLGIPRAVAGRSVADLPDAHAVDAVTCGTGPQAHFDVVAAALERGKHAITEKPFAMSVTEGEELASLAREQERVLAVVHNFQFSRSTAELRRWLAEGRLGTVRELWGVQLSNPKRRLPMWVEELPLGLFYDESPHLLYLLRRLTDADLEVLSAVAHPSGIGLPATPASLSVMMRTDRGQPVNVQMSFEAPVSEWHLAVLGEDGLGTVDLFRDSASFIPNDRSHEALNVFRTSAAATWHHWRGYLRSGPGHLRRNLLYGNQEVFRRFRDAIVDGRTLEGIGPDDALAVLRLQHRIIEAASGA
jgi:predicted dehydrogenase